MIVAREILVLLLACTVFAYAQGNSFTKVRYNGGSVASKVNAKDWGNKLTVTPEAIVLVLKDKQRVEIPSKSVTSLSYGQEAHRRVGTNDCSGDSRRTGGVVWSTPQDAAAFHRSEEHTSELQSLRHLVCRLLLEKNKT